MDARQLRNPGTAAIVAGAATVGYLYFKGKLNNEGVKKNSEYMKPAFLVMLLVYLIVAQSHGVDGPSVPINPY